MIRDPGVFIWQNNGEGVSVRVVREGEQCVGAGSRSRVGGGASEK